MTSTRLAAQARRISDRLHRGLGDEVRRLREDAGLARRVLAGEAEVDNGFLRRIEDGDTNASLETYARLAIALGADLNAHLYPNSGPTVRDRHQARILEWLLPKLSPRWQAFTEVAVRQPAKGFVDLVLFEPRESCLVATEIQSSLPRLEQIVRWSGEKAGSLHSWEGYGHLGPVRTTSKLLIVRSTHATRAVGREFARQLRIAYPAHPQDAIAALTGTREWPGPALVWVDLRAAEIRFVGRR